MHELHEPAGTGLQRQQREHQEVALSGMSLCRHDAPAFLHRSAGSIKISGKGAMSSHRTRSQAASWWPGSAKGLLLPREKVRKIIPTERQAVPLALQSLPQEDTVCTVLYDGRYISCYRTGKRSRSHCSQFPKTSAQQPSKEQTKSQGLLRREL